MRSGTPSPKRRLTARGESLAAFGAPNAAAALGTPFDGRCIPSPPQRGCRVGGPGSGCVAPPSNIPDIATPPRKLRAAGAPVLGRRALPSGRLARLGATPDLHHGLSGGAFPVTARSPFEYLRVLVVSRAILCCARVCIQRHCIVA